MKIAILGGAFDPPHIGHLLVARQTLELLGMDEIWFMVCYKYFPEFPVKFTHILSFTHRYKMVDSIKRPFFRVSNFEKVHNKQSKTHTTLKLLHEKHPNNTFHWIIGSDQLQTFYLWNNWKEIVKHYNLVIFPRDTDLENLEIRVKKSFSLQTIPSNITVINKKELIISTISSSIIRRRIRAGLSVSNMVDPAVEQYIRDHSLYI